MNFLEFLSSEIELYQRRMHPVSSRYNLTSMELSVILFLANNPEYDTARDIVEKRHLTKSHVSISLRSLEERGYLRKEFRGKDHRRAHIVLLPEADDAIKEGQRAQREFMATLTAGFSERDRNNLQEYLDRMMENIQTALTCEDGKNGR